MFNIQALLLLAALLALTQGTVIKEIPIPLEGLSMDIFLSRNPNKDNGLQPLGALRVTIKQDKLVLSTYNITVAQNSALDNRFAIRASSCPTGEERLGEFCVPIQPKIHFKEDDY